MRVPELALLILVSMGIWKYVLKRKVIWWHHLLVWVILKYVVLDLLLIALGY